MSDLPNRTYSEFPGISTRAWEHPADRAALQTLRSLKGFDSPSKHWQRCCGNASTG